MPDANKVNYSNAAFVNTNQYKAQILQVAQITGLRPEVIYGALVEENHDYLVETNINTFADTLVRLRAGGMTHQELVGAFDPILST